MKFLDLTAKEKVEFLIKEQQAIEKDWLQSWNESTSEDVPDEYSKTVFLEDCLHIVLTLIDTVKFDEKKPVKFLNSTHF